MNKKLAAFVPILTVVVILAGMIWSTLPQIASQLKLGLDIRGGFEILYQVEPI